MRIVEIEYGRTITIPGKFGNVKVSMRADVSNETAGDACWPYPETMRALRAQVEAHAQKYVAEVRDAEQTQIESPYLKRIREEIEREKEKLAAVQKRVRQAYKLVGEADDVTPEGSIRIQEGAEIPSMPTYCDRNVDDEFGEPGSEQAGGNR